MTAAIHLTASPEFEIMLWKTCYMKHVSICLQIIAAVLTYVKPRGIRRHLQTTHAASQTPINALTVPDTGKDKNIKTRIGHVRLARKSRGTGGEAVLE